MSMKTYLVVEKEEIDSRCHRFCNPLIIFGGSAKDAEVFYNYKNYTRESKAIATFTRSVARKMPPTASSGRAPFRVA